MSAQPIRLHRFAVGAGIAEDDLARLRAQRLNLFPGRALGEDELDRMQAWSDQRIAGLEASLGAPGILQGLECGLHQQDGAPLLQVLPGSGLGQDRELYSLTQALEKPWPALRDEFLSRPESPDGPLQGLYLVWLQARYLHLDVNPEQQPCRRDELDRLRDARLERVLSLSLSQVDAAFWDLPQLEQQPLQAANRWLGQLAAAPELRPEYAGISLALVAVKDNDLLWLDAAAGAFRAGPAPEHQRLRSHLYSAMQAVIEEGVAAGQAPLDAIQALAPAYLPAAAELPVFLLQDPAGVSSLPELHWFPAAAAQELQLLPASSLPLVMETNLARAATPFSELAGDRYRIGLVLADADYRDGLLALPQLEPELPDLVRREGVLAQNAGMRARVAWDRLAAGFDQAAHPEVRVPPRPPLAQTPERVLAELGARDWQAKQAGADLDAPYSETWPAPGHLPGPLEPTSADPVGLLAAYAGEQQSQERLGELLADLAALLELLEQEKQQQRGLVDALTIDLAQLAGGVAGDGSGLKLARVARGVNLAQAPDKEN